MRISVAADPAARCLATAAFRNSAVDPPDPDKTFDLLPGHVGIAEINLGRLVTRFGQRIELRPVVKILDGKCSATAEVFENLTGRLTAHLRLFVDPPDPDLPAVSVALGQILRLGVTPTVDPPDPDKSCAAVLGFFDARGNRVGPTKTVNLLPGQFDFLDLDPNLLPAGSGPRIAQPRLLPPSVGDPTRCVASLQVYEQLSGWTTEVIQGK
ncbi:MAG: hypothetical protein ACRD8O_19040 [Bryobacteraceae bacterium]